MHVLLSTQTEEQKKRGRPGNEANQEPKLVSEQLEIKHFLRRRAPRPPNLGRASPTYLPVGHISPPTTKHLLTPLNSIGGRRVATMSGLDWTGLDWTGLAMDCVTLFPHFYAYIDYGTSHTTLAILNVIITVTNSCHEFTAMMIYT